MWKLLIIILIIAIVDLRKLGFKENKKEFIIYIFLCLITLSIGIYYMTPDHLTFSKFILNMTTN